VPAADVLWIMFVIVRDADAEGAHRNGREKESFPSDVDLNMLTDMTNIDWSGTYLTS
jgi:hypothetical protein